MYKDYWPPIVGGIERSINWMAHGVKALCPEARITILVNSRSKETRTRQDGPLEIIEVGEWGRAFSAPISPAFPLELRRLKADIWHFHIPNPTGDLSWLLTRPKGKVVCTYHSDVVRQKWAMALYGPLLKSFLRRCHRIFPTSPHLIEASDYLRPLRNKCVAIPLGMPLEPFERTTEAALKAREIRRRYKGYPLVVFVGKLRYYKGLQFLISAFRALPHVHCLIIGEGPEGEKLQRLAAEFELTERIHFLGELPDAEMVAHLHAADIFVLPSHLPSEAFGLVQVEAMASGLPVISCELGTGVSFVNQEGVSGRIIPPADDTALAQAIEDLLNNPNERNRLAEGALRRARELFSRESMAKNLLTQYRSLLEDTQNPG